MRILGCSVENKIKLITYIFLALTCVMNWFVAAYQPLSLYFSKKSLKRSPTSGLFKQVLRFIPVVSSSGTLSITQTNAMRIEKDYNENNSNPLLRQIISASNLLGINFTPEKKKKSSHKNKSFKNDVINYSNYENMSGISSNNFSQDGHIVGFMDFDPKFAAITSHKSRQNKSNWFQ